MTSAMYNYPAGVNDSDFDDQAAYIREYKEWCKERKADDMPVYSFDVWIEEIVYDKEESDG